MDKQTTIIAIDPGKSGGIALFATGNITAVKMPKNVSELHTYLKMIKTTYDKPLVFVEKVQAYRGKKTLDLESKFVNLFEIFDNPLELFEAYEEFRNQDDDAPGKKFGINKMLANYKEILTVINILKIPFIEVYPVSWQNTLSLRIPKENISKTERKNRYKQFAEKCFPEIKKVTLATSDALCLVQFALHKNLHDPKWIKEKTQGGFTPGLFN